MCHGSLKKTSGRRWIWCQGAPIPFNRSTLQIAAQVSSLHSLHPLDNSPLHADAPETTGINLSQAAKFRNVVFRCGGLRADWINKTLHTIESTNLHHLTLELPRFPAIDDPIWEVVHQEWLDLDSLPVQFWVSHSLRSKVIYTLVKGEKDARGDVVKFLPELTRRGIVDPGQCFERT